MKLLLFEATFAYSVHFKVDVLYIDQKFSINLKKIK